MKASMKSDNHKKPNTYLPVQYTAYSMDSKQHASNLSWISLFPGDKEGKEVDETE